MNCVKNLSLTSNTYEVFTLKLHNLIIIIGTMMKNIYKDDDEIPSLSTKDHYPQLCYTHA